MKKNRRNNENLKHKNKQTYRKSKRKKRKGKEEHEVCPETSAKYVCPNT